MRTRKWAHWLHDAVADLDDRATVDYGPSSLVSVVDTTTDTVVATIPIGAAGWTSRNLALRPDGTQAYVTTQRPDGVGFLAVIDTANNAVTKTILLGNNTFNAVAVDANGVVYVAAFGTGPSSPGIVASVNVVTDMITPLAAVGKAPQFLAVRPGGSQLYVTNFDDDTVSVVSGTTVVATIPVGDGADGIAFNSNGTRAYVTNFQAGTVSVIDATTNTVITTIAVGASPVGVTVSPDGTAVYVATFGTGNVTVIDTASLTVVDNIPVPDGPTDVAFTPDGQRAYVTRNADDSVSAITFV
jgi:YVTN family beta-propeller protein